MSDHEVVHTDTLSAFANEAGGLALQSSEEDGLAYFARFGVDESLFSLGTTFC